MDKLKKIGTWLWKNIRITLTLVLIVLCIFILIKPKPSITEYNVWQSTFNLASVPNGLVIWKHGVIGTEMEFIHADSSARYEYFDIGILTQNNVVHKIRVPFYVLSMFRLGQVINYRSQPKEKKEKKDSLPDNYSIPKNKNEKNT